MATKASRRPFALEQAYRTGFEPGLLDLSASAAWASTLAEMTLSDGGARLLSYSLGYGPGGGSHELRAAIAALYPGLDASNVLVTAGALEAIRCAAMALVEPGQPVLVQTPAYGALRQAVVDAGGAAVDIWPESLTPAPDCELAFLNSPYGPSGRLVRGLERLSGRVVVDEVYRPIELVPGTVSPSCVELSETAVAIADLSKPLGLGGLRIGWIASRDRQAIRRCAAALDYLSGSVSSLSSAVALLALKRFDHLLATHLVTARRNLSSLATFVEQHRDAIDWLPPQAGYTAALKLRAGPPDPDLFARLRSRGIFLLDGAVFDMPDVLRIGLALPPAVFDGALTALGQELRSTTPGWDLVSSGAHVILYTKLPRHGHGKSRLAAELGSDKGAALARAFFDDSLRLARDEASRLFLALDPADDGCELARLDCASVYPQRGLEMGERLQGAFEDAFARGARNPVLLGSDSPTLPGHLLGVASRALATHDVVLGPAVDGGYYLIGLRRACSGLFQGIDWSTDRVLAQTLQRAAEAGLNVFHLPYWYDIDSAADLECLKRDARPGTSVHEALRSLAL